MFLPSGEQLEIRCEDQTAVVVEVGAGLRSYSSGDRELIDGYGPDEMCHSGRGQVLAPWPNRLEDGAYEYGGRQHQLPLNEPASNTAIHGLVRWAPWIVTQHEANLVRLEHVLYPQPGYPFPLWLQIEYALSSQGLTVTNTATNLGDQPCPYGTGSHPYLLLSSGRIDGLMLCAPADSVIHPDERGLPVKMLGVEGTGYDFRTARLIGGTKLDHAFTDLSRDERGIATVELADPRSGERVSLWMDQAYPFVMLFSGDTLPDADRRSLAVEPMTCPPNAFRTGTSLVQLEPGSSFSSVWGITPGPTALRPGEAP